LSFCTRTAKASGSGATARYDSSIGDPANISGVIVGIRSSSSCCIPELACVAEMTVRLRTTSGWRMASRSPAAPPMLKPTTSARAMPRWARSAAASSAKPS
jgi:hypothetical protein